MGEGKRSRRIEILGMLLFFFSVFLNAFFVFCFFFRSRGGWDYYKKNYEHELGWSRRAAAEAEAVAAISCSGHGRVFLDGVIVDGTPSCECNTCYGGPDCSHFLPNCPADVESGNPLFLEPYWMQNAASSAVVVSGWHRMSYKTTGSSFISLELEKHIRLLHEAVGNAVTDGRFIVFGTGSIQLLNAAIHVLSVDVNDTPNSSSPARVVASVPYYPTYKKQTILFDSREYEWEGITSKWLNASNGKFIELVTSPNNPDGHLQRSVLGGSSVIYDHCYYWPHYTAIPAPVDEDVMLFSHSKISGHASSRFGWAVIKDEGVYEKVNRYMELNTMGVSRDTQLRILKLIKVILAEIRGKGDIFKFGYDALREKWQRLSKLISQSKSFSLQQLSPQYCTYFQKIRDPSPAYGWLKCEMEEDRDCEAVLRGAGILTRGGVKFEADSQFTRLSLLKTEDDFQQLLQKLEVLISKEGFSSS